MMKGLAALLPSWRSNSHDERTCCTATLLERVEGRGESGRKGREWKEGERERKRERERGEGEGGGDRGRERERE